MIAIPCARKAAPIPASTFRPLAPRPQGARNRRLDALDAGQAADPCTVTLTRVAPSSGLDDDNLAGALKGVRDEVAKWLRVDDRDRATVLRVRAAARPWGVRIEFGPPASGRSCSRFRTIGRGVAIRSHADHAGWTMTQFDQGLACGFRAGARPPAPARPGARDPAHGRAKAARQEPGSRERRDIIDVAVTEVMSDYPGTSATLRLRTCDRSRPPIPSRALRRRRRGRQDPRHRRGRRHGRAQRSHRCAAVARAARGDRSVLADLRTHLFAAVDTIAKQGRWRHEEQLEARPLAARVLHWYLAGVSPGVPGRKYRTVPGVDRVLSDAACQQCHGLGRTGIEARGSRGPGVARPRDRSLPGRGRAAHVRPRPPGDAP